MRATTTPHTLRTLYTLHTHTLHTLLTLRGLHTTHQPSRTTHTTLTSRIIHHPPRPLASQVLSVPARPDLKKQQEDAAERVHALVPSASRQLRDLFAHVSALSSRVQPGATVVRDKMSGGVRPKCTKSFPALSS